jgi:hypothetical protein
MIVENVHAVLRGEEEFQGTLDAWIEKSDIDEPESEEDEDLEDLQEDEEHRGA